MCESVCDREETVCAFFYSSGFCSADIVASRPRMELQECGQFDVDIPYLPDSMSDITFYANDPPSAPKHPPNKPRDNNVAGCGCISSRRRHGCALHILHHQPSSEIGRLSVCDKILI